MLRFPPPWNALALGAVAVVTQWLAVVALPGFGTAQSFVRPLSAAPRVAQLAAVLGMLGVVLVLATGQALLVALARARSRRGTLVLLLAALVALPAAASIVVWRRPTAGRVRVAAMGWTDEQLQERGWQAPAARLARLYEPLLEEAVRRGARVVVSPEVGFWLPPAARAEVLPRLQALARRHRIALVAGYFDVGRHDNRIAFIDAEGVPAGEYVKTHLIPFLERYTPGNGDLVGTTVAGARLGGMICQDDKFTDLARAWGRRRAQLVAVPTNDWAQVKHYHLSNSRWRAVENRYAVVRAASNGVSAIVSPRGEVLAQADHFATGPSVIVADVSLEAGGSVYAALGDAPSSPWPRCWWSSAPSRRGAGWTRLLRDDAELDPAIASPAGFGLVGVESVNRGRTPARAGAPPRCRSGSSISSRWWRVAGRGRGCAPPRPGCPCVPRWTPA